MADEGLSAPASTPGAPPTTPGWHPHPTDPSWEMYWNGERWARSRRPQPSAAQLAASRDDTPMSNVEKAALTGAGLVVALFLGLVLTAVLALIAIALVGSSMNAGL